jgi:hypothetical protein
LTGLEPPRHPRVRQCWIGWVAAQRSSIKSLRLIQQS